MNPEYAYPTVAEAIEMHRQLDQEFGGIHGLRDRGLLESAIFRSQTGYYDDLIHEVAAHVRAIEELGLKARSLDPQRRERIDRSAFSNASQVHIFVGAVGHG